MAQTQKQQIAADCWKRVGWFICLVMTAGLHGQILAQGKKDSPKPAAVPEDFYGDQGGEKTAPANARLPNTVLRARGEDTFIKLSNPRIADTLSDKQTKGILIDYEMTSKGKFNGGALVLRAEDGSKVEIALQSIVDKESGIIQLVETKQMPTKDFFKAVTKSSKKGLGKEAVPPPNKNPAKATVNPTFPKNLEFYVVRTDDRYDTPLKVMVSNSLVMGKMKVVTRPRDWTPEELAKWGKEPPAYRNPNAFPMIGEDVQPLPKGPNPRRFVDPEGSLLGLDFANGSYAQRKRIGQIAPVYSATQPKQFETRSIAKKGYVVAGAEANLEKGYCLGLRLIFCRAKEDGSPDVKDSYFGEWIGLPAENGTAATLANDGRRVLGIYTQNVIIIDRFALVVDNKGN